jgi:hypothetical protein
MPTLDSSLTPIGVHMQLNSAETSCEDSDMASRELNSLFCPPWLLPLTVQWPRMSLDISVAPRIPCYPHFSPPHDLMCLTSANQRAPRLTIISVLKQRMDSEYIRSMLPPSNQCDALSNPQAAHGLHSFGLNPVELVVTHYSISSFPACVVYLVIVIPLIQRDQKAIPASFRTCST